MIKGEQSGEPQHFDVARLKKGMTAKHARKTR